MPGDLIPSSQSNNKFSNTSVVFRCSGCGIYNLSSMGRITNNLNQVKFGPTQGPPVNSTCHFCRSKIHMAGPMYSGPLHNKEFVSAMLKFVQDNKTKFQTSKRMEGMLTVIFEEIDAPLFYLPNDLSSTVRSPTPDYQTLASAFLNLGFKVSFSHCAAGSLKTDAPPEVIWDVMRCWAKKNPVKLEKFPKGAPGLLILGVEPSREVDFTYNPQSNTPSRCIKLVRYQLNPEKNWGPKPRHRRQVEECRSEKKQKKELS
ncbi:RNA methyltransferase tRNA(m5U54)methyltransferase, variant 2 [Entomophthora muscae]|uniref:RNA methyltransferase tRNA(M5U54)methyltransferase, variant 2 n=2 Tax=Entomophthora muscae TaxID=34485 RepID=A0ACC2S950_9FUNG|nr:RNA methyltransferase tRNA(m5U54)methyltransferase, variant 2 [Entomophthora muscae]